MRPTFYGLKTDGSRQRGKVVEAKQNEKSISTWRGRPISPTEIRPFVFSPTRLSGNFHGLLVSIAAYLSSDDDKLLNNINLLSSQDLGTIILYGGHCDILTEKSRLSGVSAFQLTTMRVDSVYQRTLRQKE